MHEKARGARLGVGRIVRAEQSDLVTHGTVTEFRHAQACMHGLRKCKTLYVGATRIHGKTNDGCVVNIKAALSDQVFVDYGVEPAVIHDVVDVAVDVVVHPSCRDRQKVFVFFATHGPVPLRQPLIQQLDPMFHHKLGATLQMRHAADICRRNLRGGACGEAFEFAAFKFVAQVGLQD